MYPSYVCKRITTSLSPERRQAQKSERPSTRELVTFRYILYHLFRVHHIHYVAGSKGGMVFFHDVEVER